MTNATITQKTFIPTYEDLAHAGRITLNSARHTLRGSLALGQLVTQVSSALLTQSQILTAALSIGYGTLALERYKGIPRANIAREKAHRTYKEIIAKEKQVSFIEANTQQKKTYLQKIFYGMRELVVSFLFIECISLFITKNLYRDCKNDKIILEKSEQARIALKKAYLSVFLEIEIFHTMRTCALQISIGVVAALTKGPIAQFLHYPGVIASNTGMMIGSILSGVLGITFFIRGTANIYHGRENLLLLQDLRKKSQAIYENKHATVPHKALEIQQLLHTYCTIEKDGKIDFLPKNARDLDEIKTDSELYQFMKTLDQGLHKKIVECEVQESLGGAMILGGLFNIIALILSGGSSVLIYTLLSSIAFLYIEETRAIYQTSKWFDSYQKDLYKQPGWLLDPKGIEKSEDLSQKTSIWWYLSRIPTAIPRLIHLSNT